MPSEEGSFVLVGDEDAFTPSTSVTGFSSPSKSEQRLVQQEQVSHSSLQSSYTPGSAHSYAHNWSKTGVGNGLKIQGRHIVDGFGRVCNLRGVNVSGCTKTPSDHDHEKFPGDHRSVTFVGRPFPLDEAHEHLARLRRWGLTFIRFLVTWEAVEHAGPGVYDQEYLSYIRKLLSMLPQYGLTAFVSMHQDVWSRYSGGSGAPAWTLETVGFDLHAIEEVGGGWLLGQRRGGHVEAERGLWPCGYQKLSAATMATCFWAGDMFAPNLKVKNQFGVLVPIQTFLQTSYLDMWTQVIKAVGDLESVVGFQLMNEPHRGYISIPSMHAFDYNTDLHLAHVPSAFQSFQLGAGYPTEVATYTRSFPFPTRHTSHTLLNTGRKKVWREDGPTNGRCLWELHDVWRWSEKKQEAVVLREHYFDRHPSTGKKVDWYTDCYFPLINAWSARVKALSPPDKMIFLEPIPNEFCPKTWTEEWRPKNMVFAPHWYDLNALFTKAFGNFNVNVQGLSRGMFPLKALYWGQKGTRDNYALQIGNLAQEGYKSLGETPVIIGECGIPMDMNEREAFRTEDFSWQAKMMDAMISALDNALVGFTLWNYNPLNTDAHGDDWNGENFSWFSNARALPPSLLDYEQDSPTLDNGGRILSSIVRPYPAKVAGIPIYFKYEITTGEFTLKWANPQAISSTEEVTPGEIPRTLRMPLLSRESEIFLPSQLAHSREILVKGLREKDRYVYDESRQTLFIVTSDDTPGLVHSITVSVDPPARAPFVLNDCWGDFGAVITFIIGALLAMFFSRVYMS